jgi:RNA polymerase sigma factor (sigma-70 family)
MAATSGPAGLSLAGAAASPLAAGEVAELYGTLSRRLRAIVRATGPAAEAIVEEACQVAWFRLISYRQCVQPDKALGWLSATAIREARRLAVRQYREASLEQELVRRGERHFGLDAPGSDEVLEARERLCSLGTVTARQRRLLWLHAMGWSYVEIAQHEGCSLRTVERQLLRAKRAVRAPTAPGPAFASGARPD